MTIKSIMARKSVRNYTGEPLDSVDAEKLRAFIGKCNETTGVFGNKVRLHLIESSGTHEKLGTYGMIKGARAFMAASCEKGSHDMEDIGFQFTKLILFATEIGLGTVFIGGTFSRNGFARAVRLGVGELLPIVSPVGHEGGKKSLLGRIVKSNAGKRKPWSELFFDGDFNTPLSIQGEFAEVLEAVRQAPSAINGQPWRVVQEGGRAFHFYSAGKTDMNRIDMGIALCHFCIAAEEKRLKGRVEIQERPNQGGLTYLASWIKND